MYQNYLKIALRNFFRNKVFSAINVLGLAFGMTASLLIFLWISDEWSIGRNYKNVSQIYRVMEREFTDGKVVADDDTPGVLADELKRQFPEVMYAAGFSWQEGHLLSLNDKSERFNGCFAGADWFQIYSVPLLAGTPKTALNAPQSLSISRKVAEHYFGTPAAALGKSLQFDNSQNYRITAVFEDLPATSADQYDFLLSWDVFFQREPWLKFWTNAGPQTRLMLREDANRSVVDAKLKWFLKGRNTDFSKTFHINLFLQPETEAYLYSNYKDGYLHGGRIDHVRLLAVVAGFLLLIAVINFMNLSTARAGRRAREVGVRKVVGAGRPSLVGQFMSEAILLTCLSMLLAIVMIVLLLPLFNNLTDKTLSLPIGEPYFWGILLGMLFFTGILSGSYPALFLSSLNPLKTLKGLLPVSQINSGAHLFRRALVVFQFVMSMLLIVGTVVVYQQLEFIRSKDLGYNRENLIIIASDGELPQNYDTFKAELLKTTGVQAVTHMYANPLGNGSTTEGITWPGKDPQAAISFNNTAAGYDFAETMKIKFVDGRDFSPEFASDSTNYLINEAAAKRIGYKNPVGQPLTMWDKPGKIVGLMQDFHFNSLHEQIRPLIIRFSPGHYGNILIRTQPGQTAGALASVERLYKKINPKFPFKYSFVDSDYERTYRSEDIVGRLATIFSGLAIFIACLGLFGLAAFTAEQRTKEIGVRKVLGASVAGIVALLSGDFLKLVCTAILIATPVSWFVMNKWLTSYAYKIEISWWVFVLAGLLSIGIALLTISFQSIKAALMNPVKSLKNE
ncbi:ABC transporter permease [Dyadobacter aurulentus]|uniref:ABC transporter permease n=1 Tax=Dyadobacter sp. UC 10 TaxID=2605428 RepID=UPI0011F37862|nr:ABC transporter permease [Dyadobacter sp. UC 10]KAA0989590.1 FtsX-like permease family protein [Dyadobacter sp. UC 10]